MAIKIFKSLIKYHRMKLLMTAILKDDVFYLLILFFKGFATVNKILIFISPWHIEHKLFSVIILQVLTFVVSYGADNFWHSSFHKFETTFYFIFLLATSKVLSLIWIVIKIILNRFLEGIYLTF